MDISLIQYKIYKISFVLLRSVESILVIPPPCLEDELPRYLCNLFLRRNSHDQAKLSLKCNCCNGSMFLTVSVIFDYTIDSTIVFPFEMVTVSHQTLPTSILFRTLFSCESSSLNKPQKSNWKRKAKKNLSQRLTFHS